MINNEKSRLTSAGEILNRYKANNKIINTVFFLMIICGVLADALTPPISYNPQVMLKKIIFIIIFTLIWEITLISTKCIRIILKRRMLIYECAPNKFLQVADGICRLERKKEYKLMCIFDMVSALIYLGRYDEALNMLNCSLVNVNKLKKYNLLRYYIDSSQCCLSLGNMDEAMKNKSMAEALIKNKKFNFAQKTNNKIAISGLEAKIAFYSNDFKKARELYHKSLITSRSPLGSIVNLYNLALIDMKENKFDCAEEKFEIVVQYGNELCQVNKSKENLNIIAQRTL